MPLSCQGLCEAEMTTPGGEGVGVGKVRDRGRGDDAGVFDRGTPGVEGRAVRVAAMDAEDSLVSMPRRTLGMVCRRLEGVGEGKADGVDGAWIKRRLACDGANAVGAKELLH